MININFYNYTGAKNVLNKSLNNPTIKTGLLYDKTDILHPVVTIRTFTTLNNLNYCFIPELNRYYFINNFEINGTKTTLYLSVDVLMSYKTDILNSFGTIVSRENANKYIVSRENIYDIRPQFQKIDFSVNSPFNSEGQIIMITLKGN
jgi:hypothetical protein